MPVTADELVAIEQLLCSADADAQVFAELRQRFSHLTWTRCDASDVTEIPFRSYPRFDVHLLDSAGHCAHVTEDPASATGIILGMRSKL